MKLKEAAKKVEDSIEETLTYCDFPGEHWTRIRTNNVIERLTGRRPIRISFTRLPVRQENISRMYMQAIARRHLCR